MVGLTFAVLNVATVAAQTAMPGAGDASAMISDNMATISGVCRQTNLCQELI